MRRSIRAWVLGAAAVACAALATADPPAAPAPAAPPPAKAVNPHWHSDRCNVCHQGREEAIPPAKADVLCLGCHDGARAKAELHPIGRPPDRARTNHPADWPLSDGRLGCLSCHDAAKACKRGKSRPLIDPMFLRGRHVGNLATALCGYCHRVGEFERFNPHVQREAGRVAEAKCDFCHNEPVSPQALVRTGRPALGRGEKALCQGCHPTHVEYFNPGHVGAKPTAGMRRRMASAGGLIGPLADGKISCSTCHNPHQAGVFPLDSDLNARGLKVVEGNQVAPTINRNRQCTVCHEMAKGSLAFKMAPESEPATPPTPAVPAVAPPTVCPVDGVKLAPDAIRAEVRGRPLRFDSVKCLRAFQVDPEKYVPGILQPPTTQPQ